MLIWLIHQTLHGHVTVSRIKLNGKSDETKTHSQNDKIEVKELRINCVTIFKIGQLSEKKAKNK